MQNKNTWRGNTQEIKNVVACPICGESQGRRPPQSRKVVMRELGKGGVNKATLLDNLPSALRATSPTQGGKSMHRGFTLIELLVVVLIIGILAAVVLPQYQKAVMKSRVAQIMVMFNAVQQSLDNYLLANNVEETFYGSDNTNKLDDLDLQIPIPSQIEELFDISISTEQHSGSDGSWLYGDIYLRAKQNTSWNWPDVIRYENENGRWEVTCTYLNTTSKAFCEAFPNANISEVL